MPRPVLVTILAVLTFVGTGLYFGYQLLVLAIPEIQMEQVEWPVWITATLYVTQIGKTIGAFFLLKMRRMGFFLYTGLEVVSAIMSMIGGKITMDYMDSGYINPAIGFDPKMAALVMLAMGMGISIAFIGGFAAHLSKMR